MMKHLRTSDLARAVGVHPNTIRRYDQQGWLPPVPRSSKGYRLFTYKHLDCLRLARMINSIYASKAIRQSATEILPEAVADDWGGALERAYAHLAFIQSERVQAEAAVMLLERWAAGTTVDSTEQPLRIGQAARLLGISIDVLRNWERNGLIAVPRQADNGYRLYGAFEISRLRVIRMLIRAGYSQMAVLRMLLQLDRDDVTSLRDLLVAPQPDEDLYTASDHWLATLADQEQVALRVIEFIEQVIKVRTSR